MADDGQIESIAGAQVDAVHFVHGYVEPWLDDRCVGVMTRPTLVESARRITFPAEGRATRSAG